MSEIVAFKISKELVDYEYAVAYMESYVEQLIKGERPDCVWLLEHPPLITAGTSYNSEELINKDALPVYLSSRGGRYTYHGPGQRVIYVMMSLHASKDIRAFVQKLELWIVNTLKRFSVEAEPDRENVGIWVPNSINGVKSKIGAIGLRVRKWVTYHGLAININTNLNHFKYFVPCGIHNLGVTSLNNEIKTTSLEVFDEVLIQEFSALFNKKVVLDA